MLAQSNVVMNTDVKSALASRLRMLRRERKLTQLQVARMMQISNSALSQYESSKRLPDYNLLCRLAELYNVTTDFMLGLTDFRMHYEDIALTRNEVLALDSVKKEHGKLFEGIIRSLSLSAHEQTTLVSLVMAYVEACQKR